MSYSRRFQLISSRDRNEVLSVADILLEADAEPLGNGAEAYGAADAEPEPFSKCVKDKL